MPITSGAEVRGEERFSLASGFQHAKLKNRITMMLKNPTSGGMRWCYLALLPVLLVAMYACNSPKSKEAESDLTIQEGPASSTYQVTVTDEPESVPFQMVEVKPTFQGGDANNFAMWVNSHLKYPEEASEKKIQGRVTLQFTIDTDGSIKDVKVIQSAHSLLDAEAMKVVSSCPEKWTPGMQDGKPVPVHYIFPVLFQLK